MKIPAQLLMILLDTISSSFSEIFDEVEIPDDMAKFMADQIEKIELPKAAKDHYLEVLGDSDGNESDE